MKYFGWKIKYFEWIMKYFEWMKTYFGWIINKFVEDVAVFFGAIQVAPNDSSVPFALFTFSLTIILWLGSLLKTISLPSLKRFCKQAVLILHGLFSKKNDLHFFKRMHNDKIFPSEHLFPPENKILHCDLISCQSTVYNEPRLAFPFNYKEK